MIGDTVLGLAVRNGARFSRLCRHHSAEMGDVAAKIVGDDALVVMVVVVVRGVDAWPRDGAVAVGRHLVPFL